MYTFEELKINLEDTHLSDHDKERFKLLINSYGDTFGMTIHDIQAGSSYLPISLPILPE